MSTTIIKMAKDATMISSTLMNAMKLIPNRHLVPIVIVHVVTRIAATFL